MPAGLRAWYTPADFEALAARQAELSGDFPVAKMTRLAEHIGSKTGQVHATFAFSRREPGWVAVAVTLHAQLGVVCQRCLGPLELEITERVEFGMAGTQVDSVALPEGVEPVVADGERFAPQQLVEDEMIMAVPLVPKHAPERCAVDADALPEGVFAGSGAAKTD